MAQTKRKRRSKHRGNAVGMVEARGRTSKPREGAKPAARTARPVKPPTFQGALIKAAIGGVVLFCLARFGVLGKQSSTASALALAAVAVIFYSPIMYLTDKWSYRRKSGQLAAKGAKR
jgi:hypothetical protein